mmetsp:Transcript_31703/g.35948  ORF Transcript_31703/g.35948 Transcript_31703/m.35948 type:complete len:132 (+) Transcript_31703:3-398(+)
MKAATGDAPAGLETAEVIAQGKRGATLLDPPHVDLRQVQVHLVQGFLQEDVAAHKDVDIGKKPPAQFLIQPASSSGDTASMCVGSADSKEQKWECRGLAFVAMTKEDVAMPMRARESVILVLWFSHAPQSS